jgi:hypothetical protein
MLLACTGIQGEVEASPFMLLMDRFFARKFIRIARSLAGLAERIAP